jgi:hypothetical protein
MKKFYDREEETRRLRNFLRRTDGGLAVVFGRRRCGKSTLLQRVLSEEQVFFQADQRESSLQREALSRAVGARLKDFDRPVYRTWDDLLSSLYAQAPAGLCVCLDEFPYLVQSEPALPSILQRNIDRPGAQVSWILCGSSQRMMHGLVLDRSAPLYGRAQEILAIGALPAGWLVPALNVDPAEAVRAYAVWGGVPRYWELAAAYPTRASAIEDLVWNRLGVLHEEPARLLLDDLRSAVQPYSILSLIGTGSHRPSEIAARLGKPVSGLARPLAQLCDLGYVRRDVPFGEHPRKTRRTLYRLGDPFLRFYFRFVLPYASSLAQGLTREAEHAWSTQAADHVASCWEDLCRLALPWMKGWDPAFGPASAWWQGAGGQAEIDVAALSLDKTALLLGECKWSERKQVFDLDAMDRQLRQKATLMPSSRGRRVITSCWLGGAAEARGSIDRLVTERDVMKVLQRG